MPSCSRPNWNVTTNLVKGFVTTQLSRILCSPEQINSLGKILQRICYYSAKYRDYLRSVMTKRNKAGVGFIVRAPSLVDGKHVFLDIRSALPVDIEWWNAYIQCEIAKEKRPDQKWNWDLLGTLYYSYAKTVGQQPKILVVSTVLDDGRSVPVAMVMIVNNYYSLNDYPRNKRASFLWFLSDAPRSALQKAKLDEDGRMLEAHEIPKMVGTIALDSAVCEAFNAITEGRMGTHADPKGGESLISWYESKKMLRLPKNIPLPVGLRSVLVSNDGRYLYYTIDNAVSFSQSLDYLR